MRLLKAALALTMPMAWSIAMMAGAIFFTASLLADDAFVQAEELSFPYDLDNPVEIFKLPHELDEISGISYSGEDTLACIQDEGGIIYIFDLSQGEVVERYRFGKGRDYEDLAVVNESAYVLQSNGHIFQVMNFREKDPVVRKLKALPLSSKNNTEGLAFDHKSNSLLIVCKGFQELKGKHVDLSGENAVYEFDLKRRTLSVRLVYPALAGGSLFQPSAIAVHPISGHIYILSSVSRRLWIVDHKGKVIAERRLNRKMFKQPEGICFHPGGDLFISNESRGRGRARILRFKYQLKTIFPK